MRRQEKAIPRRRFAITTSRVTAIPSPTADFVPYSTGFLENGLSGITMAQLTSPPFNLPPETAAMIGSSDPATQALGFSLFGLWNDTATADGTVTVTLPAP